MGTRRQAKATANRQNRLKGTNGAEEREKENNQEKQNLKFRFLYIFLKGKSFGKKLLAFDSSQVSTENKSFSKTNFLIFGH